MILAQAPFVSSGRLVEVVSQIFPGTSFLTFTMAMDGVMFDQDSQNDPLLDEAIARGETLPGTLPESSDECDKGQHAPVRLISTPARSSRAVPYELPHGGGGGKGGGAGVFDFEEMLQRMSEASACKAVSKLEGSLTAYTKRVEEVESKVDELSTEVKSELEEIKKQLRDMKSGQTPIGRSPASTPGYVFTPGRIGQFQPSFMTVKGFCTNWKTGEGALEEDEASLLAKELCKRLPAEMQGDIDAARTLRGLSLHVHAKRIDVYFSGEGLERPRAIKMKDMAMNKLGDMSNIPGLVPSGAYIVLQPDPIKGREYSLGGRMRGQLEDIGVPKQQIKVEYGYGKKGQVGIF